MENSRQVRWQQELLEGDYKIICMFGRRWMWPTSFRKRSGRIRRIMGGIRGIRENVRLRGGFGVGISGKVRLT